MDLYMKVWEVAKAKDFDIFKSRLKYAWMMAAGWFEDAEPSEQLAKNASGDW
jgi:hypothetical protein